MEIYRYSPHAIERLLAPRLRDAAPRSVLRLGPRQVGKSTLLGAPWSPTGSGHELWGIEVKAARRASADMLTGLASLADRTKRLTRKIVVCRTDRAARLGDVEVLPVRDFLAELPA